MLIPIYLSRLPEVVRIEILRASDGSEINRLEHLELLDSQIRLREHMPVLSASSAPDTNPFLTIKPKSSFATSLALSKTCVYCKESHYIQFCEKFKIWFMMKGCK